MEGVPIEYLWNYNPVTGRVAGAQQNYGERINILNSSRTLYNRMQAVQAARNAIVTERGLQSITGSGMENGVTGSGIIGEGSDEKPDAASSMKTNLADLVLAAEEAEAQRNQNLTTQRFVQEFPPVVYTDPFSRDSVFPQEFNPLFSPDGNQFSKPLHGGAISLQGFYPRLRGGAVILHGENPSLG